MGYSGLIDAMIPKKRNNLRDSNVNSHYYSTRVKYFMEYSMKFKEHTVVYSVDNMNKSKLGAWLLVDTTKLTRFISQTKLPTTRTMTFPTQGTSSLHLVTYS